jgi:lysophospholipase L1-like esterase
MLRQLARWGALLYMAASLIIVLPFVANEQLRFHYVQLIAHWKSKLIPPTYVFLGDSITAGGRNWGWGINGNPLDAINLGVSGYTTRQISFLIDKAIAYNPNIIILMAGTNDVFDRQYNLQHTIDDFESIFDKFKEAKPKLVLCLTPFTTDEPGNKRIAELNRTLRGLAKEK